MGIIIWALAKICYDPIKIRSLLQAFAQEAIDRLTEGVPKNEPNLKLGPQSLSNMVYAYAVMGHHPGNDLLAAIAQGVQGQLRDFSPQVGLVSDHCQSQLTDSHSYGRLTHSVMVD